MKTNFFISFVNSMSYIEQPIYVHLIYINFNLNKKLPKKKPPLIALNIFSEHRKIWQKSSDFRRENRNIQICRSDMSKKNA